MKDERSGALVAVKSREVADEADANDAYQEAVRLLSSSFHRNLSFLLLMMGLLLFQGNTATSMIM